VETKYIFVTGGVVSSLGKGLTAASLGRLLKARGLKVMLQKFDPYINVDPGKMSPLQHGEVFVTDDGAETDLDIGHYERFVDINLDKNSDITTGIVYSSILDKERDGVYGGGTVQVIPHITNEIKERMKRVTELRDVDVVITEIGGTVGDIESLPFLEAIRQFKFDVGRDNVLYIHVTLLPYLSKSGELKTKPTQHSVKELRGIGIQPDVLILRTEHPVDRETMNKIALFCDMDTEDVIENLDVDSIYELPLALEEQGLSKRVVEKLKLKTDEFDNSEWIELVRKVKSLEDSVKVALVAKYVDLKDSYISLFEAIDHGGFFNGVNVEVKLLDAEKINESNYMEQFSDVDGIIIPAGFGDRGLEGMILASKYSRENNIPFLGISMGMHAGVIDIARNKCGIDAIKDNSIDNAEISDIIHDPRKNESKDTRRLGLEPIKLIDNGKMVSIYEDKLIYERHRNQFEVNPQFTEKLCKDGGLVVEGTTADGKYIEIVSIEDHPWYVGVQFHPEFKSRPTKSHPLFKDFIKVCKENK